MTENMSMQTEDSMEAGLSAAGTTTQVLGWGNTHNGELGVGGIEEDHLSTPTAVKFPSRISGVAVQSISCGESHTVFVLENGKLLTCGSNDHGQLGHNKGRTRPEEVEGLDGRHIIAVSAGYAHNLAIDKWGTCYSWGSDSHGQLGLGLESEENKLIPFPRMVKALAHKTVVQVAAGQFHSMMLTNAGELYTCGSNSHGQLGLSVANGRMNQIKPCQVEILLGLPIVLISTGGFHSFALSMSGSVFGWGKNNYGQLGVSDTLDKCQPTQLSTMRTLGVKYITAGVDHSAFLTQDGGVFTCGNGLYGQLGHSSISNEILPRKILEFGSVIVQVACGRCHTLCLTEHDKVYAFGLGTSGQLGLPMTGSLSRKESPMSISTLTQPVHSLYCGGDQSFVLSSTSSSEQSNGFQPAVCDYRECKPESQIVRITAELMTQICSATEPADQDMMSLAEVVFASPASWNASFLLPDGKHIPSTWKNMGIDLALAEAALSKLEFMKASGLRDLIDQTIFKELLPKLPHQLKLVEILRVYVLLPLLPTFYLGNHTMLPVFYAERVQSLSAQLHNVVIHWFFSAPVEQLQRLISVYKRIIVQCLEATHNPFQRDAHMRTCLQFLAALYKQNKVCPKLSYHTFTIPQITNKIDVRNDYIKWLQEKGRSRSVLLCDYPFVFDAPAKTLLLQLDQTIQMQQAINQATATSVYSFFPFVQAPQPEIQFLTLVVTRANIVQDTISNLCKLTTQDLKKPLKVKFIGEEAEDAGGVKKEFFLLLIREILDPKYGMFRNYEDSRLVWFNEETFEDHVMYHIIGILCGLAIYNSIIINLPFPLALYKKILDEKVDLMDLKELNPTVAKSFEQILEYTEPDFEEVFSLNFDISQECYGSVKVVPLKPGGSSIPVTLENKAEFVELYVNYVLNVSVHKSFDAFKGGFDKVCGGTMLTLFHAQELQTMVTGNEDYDWGDLERTCTYKGGYMANEPTIVMFWEVFHDLTLEEKKQFLLFLTGSDRIPILGMKSLKMCIQPTTDEKYLPVAHTCFNLLDLPRYQTSERLKYKLLQAIQQNQGFSLV